MTAGCPSFYQTITTTTTYYLIQMKTKCLKSGSASRLAAEDAVGSTTLSPITSMFESKVGRDGTTKLYLNCLVCEKTANNCLWQLANYYNGMPLGNQQCHDKLCT